MPNSQCPVCGIPREADLIANSPCPVCALNDVVPIPPPIAPAPQATTPVPAHTSSPELSRWSSRAIFLAFTLGVIAGIFGLSVWNHLRKPSMELTKADAEVPAITPTPKLPLSTPQPQTTDPPKATPTEPSQKVVLPKLEISKTLGLKMVLIEPGEFEMGSWDMEDGRKPDEIRHVVKFSKPIYAGVSEMTQEEYRKITGLSPSSFGPKGRNESRVGKLNTDRFPVENISWYDAIEFCNRLSAKDQHSPYYDLADIKKENDSISHARVTILGGNGYRLPTEAEWEYCCRAETKSPFWFGSSNTGKEANVKPPMLAGGYGGSYPKWRDLNRPTEIGSYDANSWGICDTHGNIAEWCQDWYSGDYYSKSPRLDPVGPGEGKQRVVRGGSWFLPESSARSASRYYLSPDERKDFVGFRVVRTP